MNDLEMVTSKIVSAREIIDTAAEAIQRHEYDKAETLAMAAYEFLGYYLDEFDEKFKLAWQETVVKQKKEENDAWDAVNREKEYYEPSMPPWGHSDLEYASRHSGSTVTSCDKDDPSPECKGAWNSFWGEPIKADGYSVNGSGHSEHYYDYTRNDPNRDNPFKEDKVVKWILPTEVDGLTGDVFVNLPDDLLEAANLIEGDVIEWIDRGDGSYLMRKTTKPLKSDEC